MRRARTPFVSRDSATRIPRFVPQVVSGCRALNGPELRFGAQLGDELALLPKRAQAHPRNVLQVRKPPAAPTHHTVQLGRGPRPGRKQGAKVLDTELVHESRRGRDARIHVRPIKTPLTALASTLLALEPPLMALVQIVPRTCPKPVRVTTAAAPRLARASCHWHRRSAARPRSLALSAAARATTSQTPLARNTVRVSSALVCRVLVLRLLRHGHVQARTLAGRPLLKQSLLNPLDTENCRSAKRPLLRTLAMTSGRVTQSATSAVESMRCQNWACFANAAALSLVSRCRLCPRSLRWWRTPEVCAAGKREQCPVRPSKPPRRRDRWRDRAQSSRTVSIVAPSASLISDTSGAVGAARRC